MNALLYSLQIGHLYQRQHLMCKTATTRALPPLHPLLLSIYWTLPRPCMRPRARANASCCLMTKILLKKMLATVSAFHEDAGDDEMPLDAPVRGSEAMGSNGDVLEAIASTSRATRSRNRAVRSTPYQRVQALRWDSACPLLHLALARAKLWATTNH